MDETGLIIGLFVGFALLSDCWISTYGPYYKTTKFYIKLICGILLVLLGNIGLFYV